MAADSIWLMLLGYFAVIAGLSLHVLSEAGTTISSFKAYLKSYPLRIISGFVASTFIYITWMVNGLDLGEEILVLEKRQRKTKKKGTMKRVLYFILIILFTSSASIGKQTQLPKPTKVKRFLKVG